MRKGRVYHCKYKYDQTCLFSPTNSCYISTSLANLSTLDRKCPFPPCPRKYSFRLREHVNSYRPNPLASRRPFRPRASLVYTRVFQRGLSTTRQHFSSTQQLRHQQCQQHQQNGQHPLLYHLTLQTPLSPPSTSSTSSVNPAPPYATPSTPASPSWPPSNQPSGSASSRRNSSRPRQAMRRRNSWDG